MFEFDVIRALLPLYRTHVYQDENLTQLQQYSVDLLTKFLYIVHVLMYELTDFIIPLGYFIAGGLAGMISRTATAPLDRLKVYLIAQTNPKTAVVKAAKDGAPLQAVRNFGRPLFDACRELWKAGGMRSLFAGNGLNVVKVMPESAIKFGAYEAAKKAFAEFEGSDPKHLHPTSQFLAGGIGGAVAQCVVYPLDTLKL
jgi:solute carrier family 25 (mitochondrial phosphate transporter), member 23/24/25/41